MTTFGLHLTDFSSPNFAGERLLDGVTAITDVLDQSPLFSTLWLTDHVQHVGPAGPSAPMPEAYSLLNAVAARTNRLQLGVLATSVLYRAPTLLAKMASTLDAVSNGRAILGLGAGHPRTEDEHRAYGYEFPSVARRMELLESALETIRPMIASTSRADSPPNSPRPVRPGGIPVLVAGSGEQRLLRIAARYADMINLSFPSGDSLDRIEHKRQVLAAHCATVGRDPADIAVSYKAVVSIAQTTDLARANWESWRTGRGIPAVDSSAGVFVGTPREIAKQFEGWRRLGIDHFVIELTNTEPASVALVTEALGEAAVTVAAR